MKKTQAQFTEDAAWQAFIEHDRTPFEQTQYMQLRPAHVTNDRTSQIARQVMDAAAALDGLSARVRQADGSPSHLSDLMNEITPDTYGLARYRRISKEAAAITRPGGNTPAGGNQQTGGGNE